MITTLPVNPRWKRNEAVWQRVVGMACYVSLTSFFACLVRDVGWDKTKERRMAYSHQTRRCEHDTGSQRKSEGEYRPCIHHKNYT